jgi:hypothetical protein
MDLRIHIGLQSVELASASDVETIYMNGIVPYVGEITDIYNLKSFLATDAGIFGFRIGSDDVSINLPCSNTEDTIETSIEDEDNFQFEYELNREIIVDGRESKYKLSSYLIQKEIIEDIYQHLRLTFSNWISIHSEGSKLRVSIKKLIERRDIPSFEKIRRLELELGSTLKSWLSPDPNPFTPEPVFLRTDCTSIEDPDKCSNYCQMTNGQCKIHTPDIFQISTNERIDASDYLSKRLIDEIVRLPGRSNELLEKGVKRVQMPKTDLHIKDQWIIPQGVPAWYDLLRISTETDSELPHYYEEFSRNVNTTNISIVNDLPQVLIDILPPTTVDKLALRSIGQEALFFGIPDEIDRPFTMSTLTEISNKYKKPVIQVLINETPIRCVGRSIGSRSLKSSCIVIITGLSDGPALLVTKDTMSDSVPSKYIQGPIYSSIENIKNAKIFKRKEPRRFESK